MPNPELDALLAQVSQLPPTPLTGGSSSLFSNEVPLAHYRHIAALCAQGLREIEATAPEPQTAPGYAAFMAIGRFCMQEHTRLCREEDAKREKTRRWSEVHDEFEAAQREGRPMRAHWSWERHDTWRGELP